jgi:hypothetical protein
MEVWAPDAPDSPWAARDKCEAVKEYIVRLVMQKEAEQKAQRRTAVRAAGRVEHSARLALLRADPGGAADAFVQWKDALYALQEAGGLTTARKQGGVGPVDLL